MRAHGRRLGPLSGCLLLLLAGSCGFPPVPRGAHPGIENERLSRTPGPGAEPTAEADGGAPAAPPAQEEEVRGLLVGNAVSRFVIEREEGGFVTLEVVPGTSLRIGDQRAGLREIQPGSEVRATFVPSTSGRSALALEVEATPEKVGWSGRRRSSAPTPGKPFGPRGRSIR